MALTQLFIISLSWIGAANQFVNELKDPFRWRRWRLPRRLQSIIPFLCYSLILTLHFAVSREEAAWALRQRRILVDGIPAAQLTEPKYPAAQVNVGAWKAIQVVNFLLSAIGWFVVAYVSGVAEVLLPSFSFICNFLSPSDNEDPGGKSPRNNPTRSKNGTWTSTNWHGHATIRCGAQDVTLDN